MIRHTPGDWVLEANGPCWNLRSPDRVDHFLVLVGMLHNNPGELKANAHLIATARTAPHECADTQCPGNINRRKLEAFDGLLAVCEQYHTQFRKEVHRDGATALSLVDASALYSDATAAIANAKKPTTPE